MFVDQFWNWSFADALHEGRARLRLPGATLDERMEGLAGSPDFLGLNYYFRYFVRLAPGTPEMVAMEPGPGLRSEPGGTSPVGDRPPEALFQLMREAGKRYRLPSAITEGGIADDEETMRGPLIRGQFEAIQRARAEGIAVTGYFHWTLVDNFEWEEGYRPRFGLYRLDRQTLARTRPVARRSSPLSRLSSARCQHPRPALTSSGEARAGLRCRGACCGRARGGGEAGPWRATGAPSSRPAGRASRP
jgi:beta-glucosidase